ncbi:MAG: flagellar motor switch phosphatase FliY [Eubacterium sp.]|nr:flagellar motor switch phosphatase FliY [Eubacterium sp.]
MDGMLSQEEINALLGSMEEESGGGDSSSDASAAAPDSGASAAGAGDTLNADEADALGEIANISMGTAATTLSILVNNRVDITTPTVTTISIDDLSREQPTPCVFIHISYVKGLEGKNILILKEDDVKVITDLMMGGDGTNVDNELSELHLSAICEAMNQMMGSAATSMSSMINDTVDISPPTATRVDLAENIKGELEGLVESSFVQVAFHMEIGDLVDSQIMQLYPVDFARRVYRQFAGISDEPEPAPAPAPEPAPAQAAAPPPVATPAPEPMPQAAPAAQAPPPMQMAPPPMQMAPPPMYGYPPQDYNIQPAQFQSFMAPPDLSGIAPENIDLIMDVPLEVTVELGRTSKSIKEILDFSPGTIIELDKLAGEPIDVLVNGKFVAKGEVVVIEESFGIRVTEIVKES